MTGVDPGDVQARGKSQHLWKTRRARPSDIFVSDDVDRSGTLKKGFRPLGHRRHVDVTQLLQTQVRQSDLGDRWLLKPMNVAAPAEERQDDESLFHIGN